jgi:hypothetical protein
VQSPGAAAALRLHSRTRRADLASFSVIVSAAVSVVLGKIAVYPRIRTGACDVTAVVAGEKHHGFRDIIGGVRSFVQVRGGATARMFNGSRDLCARTRFLVGDPSRTSIWDPAGDEWHCVRGHWEP